MKTIKTGDRGIYMETIGHHGDGIRVTDNGYAVYEDMMRDGDYLNTGGTDFFAYWHGGVCFVLYRFGRERDLFKAIAYERASRRVTASGQLRMRGVGSRLGHTNAPWGFTILSTDGGGGHAVGSLRYDGAKRSWAVA